MLFILSVAGSYSHLPFILPSPFTPCVCHGTQTAHTRRMQPHKHAPTRCPRHSRCPEPARTHPASTSCQALPSSSTAWCRATGPPSPEWAGAGQEHSPGLGREQWVSCLRRWELSCACTTRVALGCAGFSCAVVFSLAATGK